MFWGQDHSCLGVICGICRLSPYALCPRFWVLKLTTVEFTSSRALRTFVVWMLCKQTTSRWVWLLRKIERSSVVRYLEHSDSDAHADNDRSVLLNPLDYCVRTTLQIKAVHFFYFVSIQMKTTQWDVNQMTSRSEVVSIYKCPPPPKKNWGPPQIWGAKISILTTFLRLPYSTPHISGTKRCID